MMTTSRGRLAAAGAATLALLVAGTAVASAAGPGDDPWGQGGNRMGGGPMRQRMMDRFPALGQRFDTLVRIETTLDLPDQGIVVRRQDHGTATTVADTGLSYSLANGETATVTTDADTVIVSVQASTGTRPFRMAADQIAVSDIAAGADVVVWSEGQSDGSFLAKRIVVLPAAAASSGGTESPAQSTAPEPSASPAAAA